MKCSLTMLRDYVDIPCAPEVYAEKMVMSGTGVEGIENLAEGIQNVVVGQVLTCEKLEGSDHLHVCTVAVAPQSAAAQPPCAAAQPPCAAAQPLQVVCGAPNVAVGLRVAVALEGAKLPGGAVIKKGKLRGVVSEGMLCSATELNVPVDLYPSVGDAGLLVIREDVPLGSDVRPLLGVDDVAMDFEILANRPDCLCAIGLARETAAVLDTPLHLPAITVKEAGGDVHAQVRVKVEAPDLCPRYCARVITNVRIGPSPLWLRKYLHSAGLRSINNIVDITNFVMLEHGHPMHAFDLDQVRGRTVIVRRARAGEKLTTLDQVERSLRPEDLLICDNEGPTGLAGIMGGQESEITPATRTVMFECASFDRTAVRLTGRALGLRTESSGRFERGVAPATVWDALERACMLVNQLDAGDVVSGAIDLYPGPQKPQVVAASVKRIARRAGVDIPAKAMEEILTRLGFGVQLEGDALTATVPAWRGDIEGEADLCEEVLRLYGYQHIGADPLVGSATQGGVSPMLRLKNRTAAILQGAGYYECMNYSFQGVKEIAKLGLEPGDWRLSPMPIRNPLGEDTAVMRPSLAPDMLKTLAFNMRHATEKASLYEMAAVFDPHHPTSEGLPAERQTLCLGGYGPQADFYALREAVLAVLRAQGIACEAQPGADPYYHPGRSARLVRGATVYAQLGEVHPAVREAFDMKGRALLAEVDLQQMLADAAPMGEMKPLPRFPGMARDLALVMDESVAVGPLMAEMQKAAGNLLESISLFDVYRGAQLGEGKKSAAFSLAFRAPDRTLVDEEVQRAMDKVCKMCQERFGAVIRG